jgi:hypothetical protein
MDRPFVSRRRTRAPRENRFLPSWPSRPGCALGWLGRLGRGKELSDNYPWEGISLGSSDISGDGYRLRTTHRLLVLLSEIPEV